MTESDPQEPEGISKDTWTYRGGIKYRVNDIVALRSSAGTAYWPGTALWYFQKISTGKTWREPNPNLKPEKTWMVDYGVDVTLPTTNTALSVTGYYGRIRDIVSYRYDENPDVPGGTIIRTQNLGEAEIYGVELYGKQKLLEHLWLTASLTLNHSRVVEDPKNEGHQLRNAPDYWGSVGLAYLNPEVVNASLSVRFSDDRYYDDENTELPFFHMQAYKTVDLKVWRDWKLSPHWTLTTSLSAVNLLDEDYETEIVYVNPVHRGDGESQVALLGKPQRFICTVLFTLLLWVEGSSAARTLTIGIGRSFFDGPESAHFLHGSTRTWEALVDLNDELSPVPWLAERWESSPDATTWTFTLRDGVRFHNGALLNAEDVVANIRRIREHPRYDPLDRYHGVEEVRALGDRRVVFRLREPSPLFPNLVAYYGSPILHPSSWDERGRIVRFFATGPYRLKHLVPDEVVILERNDHYWGTYPPYEHLVFRTIPDPYTRVASLIAGAIDAIVDVGGILPDQRPLLLSNQAITVLSKEVATTHYLIFNNRREPCQSRAFRRWLAGALNRETIVASLLPGAATVARSPYTPLVGKWSFALVNPSPEPFPGTSIPAGEQPLTILLHHGTILRWPYREIAQLLESLFRNQGITSHILIQEKGQYYETLNRGAFHLTLQPFTLMTGDPHLFYAHFIASRAPRGTGWQDQHADNLIHQAQRERIEERRREIYRQLEILLAEHLPLLPLFHEKTTYAFRKEVGWVGMDSLFRPLLIEGEK